MSEIEWIKQTWKGWRLLDKILASFAFSIMVFAWVTGIILLLFLV